MEYYELENLKDPKELIAQNERQAMDAVDTVGF